MRGLRLSSERVIFGLTVFFGVTAAVVLGCLMVALFVPYNRSIIEPQGAAQSDERVSDDSGAPDSGFSADIFSRKRLFEGPDAAGSTPPGQAQQGGMALLGVSLGDRKLAMIRDTAGKSYCVAEGDSVASFRVLAIEKERVTLEAGGKTLELTK